jgi:hypothetical protein
MDPRHKRDPTTFPSHDRPIKHLTLEINIPNNEKETVEETKKRIHYHLSKSKSTVFVAGKLKEEMPRVEFEKNHKSKCGCF